MRRTEVNLIVENLEGEPIESVEINATIPLAYAALLCTSDRACDALEKDLKAWLDSKWKMLKPVAKQIRKRAALRP